MHLNMHHVKLTTLYMTGILFKTTLYALISFVDIYTLIVLIFVLIKVSYILKILFNRQLCF